MIKLVVFDMAGTSVDEDNVVYKTLQKAIEAAGYPVSLEKVLEHGAGKEKLQAVRDILMAQYQLQDQKLAADIHGNFLEMLKIAYANLEVKPQPFAEETFESLKKKGIKVVLNTGYNHQTASSLIEKLGWSVGNQIDGYVTASEVSNSRPHPDMILLAMEQQGIANAAEVLKIGDSIIDIEEGKNANCGLNIGITTGAHTRAQLESAQPDRIINSLPELLELV